jgi:hypothetical protein
MLRLLCAVTLLSAVTLTTGCRSKSTSTATTKPQATRTGTVVATAPGSSTAERLAPGGGPRKLTVPPGHYPPAGQCRVWVPGVPPGRQTRPAPCNQLGRIPAGAFVLHGGNAWDTDFDWAGEERRKPGTVPGAVLTVIEAARAAKEEAKKQEQRSNRRP